MRCPGFDLVARGAQRLDGLWISVDDDAHVTGRAALHGGDIGDEHEVDLGARTLEPHRAACDSGRRGDGIEPEQAVKRRALVQLGRQDFPCDVLDHGVRNSQIAGIVGKGECSTGL
jgi:hypothetical protein